MKKALLFCVSLLLCVVSGLQAAPANATFYSERGIPFQLVFDGRALTRGGASQVALDRLVPGYHVAEFIIPTGYGRSINYRTQVFLDGGLESSFVLLTRNGFPPALRKVSAVPIRGNYPPNGGSYPNGGYGGTYPGGNAPNQPSYPAPGPAYPNPGPAYPNNPRNDTNYYVMSPQDVNRLLQSVQRQSFDDNKLPILRDALRDTGIEAEDLRQLLSTLTFDRNRVELAKYAYPRVADPQRFYQVYEAFDFQSSVQELQRFVDGYNR